MILVDADLLLYAEDTVSEHHEAARIWWDTQLSGAEPVCLCWPVLTAFIRIGTNLRLHRRPLTLKEAVERVQSWLDQPCVRMIHPGEQHWPIFQAMLRDGKAIRQPCIGRASRCPGGRAQLHFTKARTRIFHGSKA